MKRRPLPTTSDAPTGPDLAADLPDLGAVGLEDPSASLGQDPTAGGAPVGGDTGGLSNEDLSNIDLSALGDLGTGGGDMGLGADPTLDPTADPGAQDPDLQLMLDALNGGGTPEDQQMAQQMLEEAIRRQMGAGA